MLVIGYILYVSFYDAQDFPWKRNKQDALPQFSPKPDAAPVPAK